MELISQIPLIGGFLSTVLPFVVVLGIVVFVHEYGHYIVARWCGIHSEVFSIGFGPVLWSRRDSRNTLWQVAAIPLGGYVKFLGDADGSSRADPDAYHELSAEDRGRSFHYASVWRRMATVVAGPVFNFILTIAIFFGVITWNGVSVTEPVIGEVSSVGEGRFSTLQVGDRVLTANGTEITTFEGILQAALDMEEPGPMVFEIERDGQQMEVETPFAFPPLVGGVSPLSPASRAGLEPGDLILTADGQDLVAFEDLRQVVMASGDETIPMTVERDGEELTLSITPLEQDIENGEGGFERRVMIGVAGATLYMPAFERPNPIEALGLAVSSMANIITQSLNGLKHMIVGDLGVDNLQGPLGIAQISGETAQHGLMSFIRLIAVISTAIGMLNLFPIPVLDGGHLVAFAYEAIRGKPPGQAVMRIAMSIGLGLILLMMVFATYNDIMRMVS